MYTRNVLTDEHIDHIFDLYHTLPNLVNVNGEEIERFYGSLTGHFVIAEFSFDEVDDILKHIKTYMSADVKVTYVRLLKYNPTCFIPRHKDGFNSFQQPSSKSSIIQLNDPNSYIGGELIVNEDVTDLQKGDMITYNYDNIHQVKKVNKGIRYVLNLRHT
jgi:hypothetical protein